MWPSADIPGQVFYILGIVLFLLLAAAAFRHAWFYDRAKGKPRCRKCGYPADASNTPGQPGWAGCLSNQPEQADATDSPKPHGSCPECGWSPKRVKDFYRTRRSRRWLAVSLLLLAASCSTWYATHVQFRRLHLNEPTAIALTPTTWWIAVLPYRSGDEDLIVYHRAYPWGKMPGATGGTGTLLGSGRQYALAPGGNTGGYAHLWDWQSRWSADQFKSQISDTNRSLRQRTDAVFFFARVSPLRDRGDIAALLHPLQSNDRMLTQAVLIELDEVSAAPDMVASALIPVIEDMNNPKNLRLLAAQELGRRGDPALPYVLDWIGQDNETMRQCISTAAYKIYWHKHERNEPLEPFVLQVWEAYYSSPHAEDLRSGIVWLGAAMHKALMQGDIASLCRLFNETYLQLVKLETHPDQSVRYQAEDKHFTFLSLASGALRPAEAADVAAWAGLLSQPGVVERVVAADGLDQLINSSLSDGESQRSIRDAVRPVIQSAIQQDQCAEVRSKLESILHLLDETDAQR
ncbi:hypothetical protein OT109_11070 [Phycisphaeraceae bacterium D3-23]